MRHQAIANLYSNVTTQVNEKAYDKDSKLVEIDEDKVAEEVKRLQSDFDSKAYARSRQEEYPDLQECIHALLDGGDTLTELQTKRSEIKQKYPKPA